MYTEHLEVAIGLAQRAGVIARDFFVTERERVWKADNTPVTAADIAINELVVSELERHFPSHGVLGEEVSRHVESAEYVWVCDPIDGTIPFALGVPTSAFSLGLVRDGVTVLGVAYDFHADRLYTAMRGHGAFVNGQPLQAFVGETLQASVSDLEGIWMRGMNEDLDLTLLPGLLEQAGSKILKVCSMVYAGLLVAQGELAGMVSKGDKPWDVAALAVLVEEAGGTVTDLFGAPLRCDRPIRGCVISGSKVHGEYRRLIEAALPPS